jgi:hypothetical protein
MCSVALHMRTTKPLTPLLSDQWATLVGCACTIRYCRLPFGYGSFPDVSQPGATAEDKQESYFLGETMKCVPQLFLLLWLSIPSAFLVVFEKRNRSSFA